MLKLILKIIEDSSLNAIFRLIMFLQSEAIYLMSGCFICYFEIIMLFQLKYVCLEYIFVILKVDFYKVYFCSLKPRQYYLGKDFSNKLAIITVLLKLNCLLHS